MYKITITPMDPCQPDDKMEARETTLLFTIAKLLTKLHENTYVDELVGLEDILFCLSEVVKQIENDCETVAESTYHDMDPTYSFTIKCEWIPS